MKKHIILKATDKLLELIGKLIHRCVKVGREAEDSERWDRVQDNLQAIMTLLVTQRDELKSLLKQEETGDKS